MQTKTERHLFGEHKDTAASISFQAAVNVIERYSLKEEYRSEIARVAVDRGHPEIAKALFQEKAAEELSKISFSERKTLLEGPQ